MQSLIFTFWLNIKKRKRLQTFSAVFKKYSVLHPHIWKNVPMERYNVMPNWLIYLFSTIDKQTQSISSYRFLERLQQKNSEMVRESWRLKLGKNVKSSQLTAGRFIEFLEYYNFHLQWINFKIHSCSVSELITLLFINFLSNGLAVFITHRNQFGSYLRNMSSSVLIAHLPQNNQFQWEASQYTDF